MAFSQCGKMQETAVEADGLLTWIRRDELLNWTISGWRWCVAYLSVDNATVCTNDALLTTIAIA